MRPALPAPQINNHHVVLNCGGDVLTLPAPDFDSGEKFEYSRVNTRSRGGDLIIFRAPYWTKVNVFSMQWSTLDHTTRSKTIVFIREHLGQLMTLTDQEGRVFSVIIRTPDSEFKQDKIGFHSIKLDFETE